MESLGKLNPAESGLFDSDGRESVEFVRVRNWRLMREFTAGVASLRVLELGRSPYKVIKIYPKAVTKLNSADGARKSSAGNFDGVRRSGIRGDRYFILALSL